MSKHTKGKWTLKHEDHGQWNINAEDGYTIASCPDDPEYGRPKEDPHNMKRIVDCVNACEGIEDPSVVPDMLKALKLNQRLLSNLMAKGNINWGGTFGIDDFGLMNETLLAMDRAVIKAEGKPERKKLRKYAGDAI